MKALLLKDLYALKDSRAQLIFIIGIAVVMSILGNTVFIQSYVTAISAVLILNVIAYDEADNGYAFLFTLPISRKEYVMEKYIFGWAMAFAGWGIAFILSEIVRTFYETNGSLHWYVSWHVFGKELVLMYGGILVAMLVVQEILIPVQLKFGGQKGKLAGLLVVAAIFGSAVLGAKIIGGTLDNGFAIIGKFLSACTLAQMLGIGIAALLVSAGVSLSFSLRIMEHKAF